MKASRSARGSADWVRRSSPAASARRILRRISWRAFLSSVRGSRRSRCPRGNVTTGQTSSRSRLSVQPLGRSRARRRRPPGPRRRGRRSAGGAGRSTSHGAGMVGIGEAPATREVVDDGVGDGRQVGRGGEDRGVVGVVGGAEEDRLRGRRDRRQVGRRRRGGSSCAVSASPARPRGDASAGRSRPARRPRRRRPSPVAARDDQGLVVGARRRTRPTRPAGTPSRERRRPRVARREASQVARGMSSNAHALDAQGARGVRGSGRIEGRRCACGRRVEPGQAGSASGAWVVTRPRISPGPRE